MRFRHIYMAVGSLAVLALWFLTDPDLGLIQNMPFGAGTLAMIVILSKAVIYVALLHLSRKGLADYVDLSQFFEKASESPEGAGSALIAMSIMMAAIAILIYAAVSG